MASGLDKHGIDSEKPLNYTHIDIAGAAWLKENTDPVFSAPMFTIAGAYILPRVGLADIFASRCHSTQDNKDSCKK